jgi:hypothetical protein
MGVLKTILRAVALAALASGCATPAHRQAPTVAVLYRQEAVRDLRWNTQVFYTAEALKADPSLHDGFVHPDLNARYAVFNTGHTQFAMFGQVANPVPAVLSASLESLTGLAVPPADVGSCQLGVDGGAAKGINALQAHGTALGVCLAPRALTDRPFLHGVYGLYNWASPSAPFADHPGARLRVEGYFRHPYTSVKSVAEGLIAQEGAVFFYYTLQFRDTTQNRDLWFVVRLYQNQFARPSDPWTTLMDREALAVDGTNPATSIGLIDAILRPGTTRVTPVPGSAFFSLTPFSGERYFAFDLSDSQFRQALQDLNAARVAPVVFSENPADYQLKHYNINVESWAPSPECDPRIGLSWRDITISMVDSVPAPAGDARGAGGRKAP